MTNEKVNQLRKDVDAYFKTSGVSKHGFCRDNHVSSSTLWDFLKGGGISEKTYKKVKKALDKDFYTNKNEDEKSTPIKKNIPVEDVDEGLLDTAITKLIDKKIDATMKQINDLQTKLENLKASKDIIRELLD